LETQPKVSNVLLLFESKLIKKKGDEKRWDFVGLLIGGTVFVQRMH